MTSTIAPKPLALPPQPPNAPKLPYRRLWPTAEKIDMLIGRGILK